MEAGARLVHESLLSRQRRASRDAEQLVRALGDVRHSLDRCRSLVFQRLLPPSLVAVSSAANSPPHPIELVDVLNFVNLALPEAIQLEPLEMELDFSDLPTISGVPAASANTTPVKRAGSNTPSPNKTNPQAP